MSVQLSYCIAVLAAAAGGFLTAFAYKLLLSREGSLREFFYALIGICPVTAAVVIAASVHAYMALGLIGVLAIIRFRVAVKNPLEVVFLYLSVALGLLCGTGMYILAAAGFVITVLALSLAIFIPKKKKVYKVKSVKKIKR